MNSWKKAQEETLHIFFCSKLGMKPEKLEGKCAAAKEKEVYYGYCILNTPITQSSKTASSVCSQRENLTAARAQPYRSNNIPLRVRNLSKQYHNERVLAPLCEVFRFASVGSFSLT